VAEYHELLYKLRVGQVLFALVFVVELDSKFI
jgi:hypothetical protein